MVHIVLIYQRRIVVCHRELNVGQRASMSSHRAMDRMQSRQCPWTMVVIKDAVRIDHIQLIIVDHRPHNTVSAPAHV